MPNDQQSGQNQTTATSQTTGDLQIKPVGAAISQDPAATQPVAVTTAPVQSQPVPTPAPAINLAAADVAPAKPVNKRAFNLAEGSDESAAGQVVPEKFIIPKLVREKYPDMIDLIKTTESMDDQERQYWFQIMPIMTAEQVDKFRNILVTEKNQLSELDKEYEDELNRLNEKHLLEWKEFETKEKSRTIKEAEAKSTAEEKQQEEDLLAKLSDV